MSRLNNTPKDDDRAMEDQRRLIRRAGLKTPPVIFDIGANIGQRAKQYRSTFPSALIHCFEPTPETFEELEKRTKNDSNLVCHSEFLSSGAGAEYLHINTYSGTNSKYPRAQGRRYFPSRSTVVNKIKVNAVSLDSIVCTEKLQSPNIIKIDVQGAELDVLRGSVEVLSRGGYLLILMEVMFVPHYEKAPLFYETYKYLSDLDYTLYDLYSLHRARNGQLRQGDALFISPSVRKIVDTFPPEP